MTSKQHVVRLSGDERLRLSGLIRRDGASAHEQRRARILLHADVGYTGSRLTDIEIAAAVGVEPRTVARVRSQYEREGLEGTLHRRPRGDRQPRKLEGEGEVRLIALVSSDPPPGQQRWTLRLLAKTLVVLEVVESISPETVRITLKKTSSNPGQSSAGVSLRSRMPPLPPPWKMYWRFMRDPSIHCGRWSVLTKAASNCNGM